MKKRILVLCLLLSMALLFSACENGKKKDDSCEHTFSEAWSSDATNHWHRATCEHGEVKDGLAAHVDAGQDGLCDVCGYEIGHEHTYAEAWSSDETKHWKAATCAHADQKGSEGIHADDDKNYKCDVCTAHCHIVNPATGYCDDCNKKITEVDTSKMATILNAIVVNANKIVSGTVDYDAIFRGVTSDLTQAHDVEYSVHTDGLYTKRTEGAWAIEVWKQMKGEDVTAISVEKTNGLITKAEPTTADVESLAGYYYAVSTLASGHGAEDILNALYELATPAEGSLNKVSNYAEEINQDTRTAKFSYNILVINTDTAAGEDDGVDYYEVKVEFGYSEANVLTSMTIICDCYTNSLENEAEQDYTYDQATKTITMKDTAKADTYTFVVAQTAGTQAAIDMATPNAFIPTDLFIYADEAHTTVATTLTVSLTTPTDELPVFYVGCPEGTFIYFLDDITVTVDKEGMTASLVDDTIQFYPGIAGTYVITLTSGSISKSVTVVVEGEEIQGSNTFDVVVTDTYGWEDFYEFTATESGTYTFFIPQGLGIWEKSARGPAIDYQAPPSDLTITVELAAGSSYSFYVGAMTKGTYTIGYNFVAHEVEVGGGEEGGDDTTTIQGTYTGTDDWGNSPLTVVIDATTVTFNYSHPMMGDQTATYTYAIVDGAMVLYDENDNVLNPLAGKVTLTNGVPTAAAYNGTDYTLALGESDDEASIEGTYTGTDMWGNSPLTVVIDATTVTFNFSHPMQGDQSATYTYEIVDGEMVIYNEDGSVLNPLAGAVILTDGVPTGAAYNGTDYTFGEGGSDDDDNNDNDDVVVEPSGTLYDEEENTISVTADDITAGKVVYTFMPNNSGEYSFQSNDLGIKAIYDADGNEIEMNDNWCYELEAYATYTVEINTSHLYSAGDFTMTPEYQYPEGHQENPFYFDWDYEFGNSVTATYKGDYQTVWYSFYAEQTGTVQVTTTNANATILLTAVFGSEVESVDGVVSLSVIKGRQYYIGVVDSNFSEETFDIEFTPSYTGDAYVANGTQNAPHFIEIGKNTASVPEYESVWFAYKAEATGTLTVTTASEICAWYFDGQEEWATAGDKSIWVEEGGIVYLYVETSDWSAADIVFTASFVADPTEVWGGDAIADGSAANTIIVEENTYVSLTFGGAGEFTITWDNADAIVEVVAWGTPNTPVENGGTIIGSNWGNNLIVYFPGYAEGTVNVTITPC